MINLLRCKITKTRKNNDFSIFSIFDCILEFGGNQKPSLRCCSGISKCQDMCTRTKPLDQTIPWFLLACIAKNWEPNLTFCELQRLFHPLIKIHGKSSLVVLKYFSKMMCWWSSWCARLRFEKCRVGSHTRGK